MSESCICCREECKVKTACGHHVHDRCFLLWCRERGSQNAQWICPTCRTPITDEDARIICCRELFENIKNLERLDDLKMIMTSSDIEGRTPGGFFGQMKRARLISAALYRRRHGAPPRAPRDPFAPRKPFKR